MLLRELYEAQVKNIVAVMPGGFHPFHPGHKSLYDWAVETFGKENVYVAATDDTKERPFPFDVKKKLAAMAGVPANRFIQVKSPFNALSYEGLLGDPANTALVFIRSEKDQGTHPKPDQIRKSDGNMGYLISYKGKEDLVGADTHGYMTYGPTIDFNFSGMAINSASQLRAAWPEMSPEDKMKAADLMYPGQGKTAAALLDKALGVKELEPAEDVSPEDEGKFHNELDDLVHKYFGDSPDEEKMKKKMKKVKPSKETNEILGFATKNQKKTTIKKKRPPEEDSVKDKLAKRRAMAAKGDPKAYKSGGLDESTLLENKIGKEFIEWLIKKFPDKKPDWFNNLFGDILRKNKDKADDLFKKGELDDPKVDPKGKKTDKKPNEKKPDEAPKIDEPGANPKTDKKLPKKKKDDPDRDPDMGPDPSQMPNPKFVNPETEDKVEDELTDQIPAPLLDKLKKYGFSTAQIAILAMGGIYIARALTGRGPFGKGFQKYNSLEPYGDLVDPDKNNNGGGSGGGFFGSEKNKNSKNGDSKNKKTPPKKTTPKGKGKFKLPISTPDQDRSSMTFASMYSEGSLKIPASGLRNMVIKMIQDLDARNDTAKLAKIARLLGKEVYYKGDKVVLQDPDFDYYAKENIDKLVDLYTEACSRKRKKKIKEEQLNELAFLPLFVNLLIAAGVLWSIYDLYDLYSQYKDGEITEDELKDAAGEEIALSLISIAAIGGAKLTFKGFKKLYDLAKKKKK